MERRRRIAAYGLCFDEEGRVLLVRAAARTGAAASRPARWLLPGGGIEHGEHPADAVVREVSEETGLRVAVQRVRDIVTDVEHLADIDALRHQDRIIFDVRVVDGGLRPETGGSSDQVAWVEQGRVATLPLFPYAARLLGVTDRQDPVEPRWTGRGDGVVASSALGRRQRFGAYGLATDPAGRVLLSRIAPGYPGAGQWHLPGGGTDFGESAVAGLTRELLEETDQAGTVTELLSVSHRHQRGLRGPEGVPLDWHGVRALFRVRV
ncbi:MAG TPA: NUDIX hydrolase, partial [Micromonosporaceae bacterium]